MTIKAFISYSHLDRQLASVVKNRLQEFDIPAFMAHEDIEVSREWRDRIIQELNVADIFIPLLSKSFKTSDWAPQEVGIAVGKSKMLIIPLSIDGTNPFGFIAKIQGKRLSDASDYYRLLIEPILLRFPHAVIPGLIERMASAGSFRNAESLMLPLVPLFDKFNKQEVDRFMDATISNGQIWDASECKQNYLPQFFKTNRAKIDKRKLRELQKLMDE